MKVIILAAEQGIRLRLLTDPSVWWKSMGEVLLKDSLIQCVPARFGKKVDNMRFLQRGAKGWV